MGYVLPDLEKIRSRGSFSALSHEKDVLQTHLVVYAVALLSCHVRISCAESRLWMPALLRMTWNMQMHVLLRIIGLRFDE